MKRFGQIEIITAVIMIVTSLAGSVLAAITWSGDVDPSDPSTWDSSTEGRIGYYANGTMSITGGSGVIGLSGILGYGGNTMGAVTVDGAGSTWTNGSSFWVGYNGSGTLDITNGGVVSGVDGSGVIGGWYQSRSTATVDGEGSALIVGGRLTTGLSGNGTLDITNGGVVSSGSGRVGQGGTGAVTVDGAGSKWTNNDSLEVGREFQSDGTLNIIGGGAVSNRSGYIGYLSGSIGEVTVDGAGSTLTNSEDFWVGYEGDGTLNITDRGLVSVAETLTIDYNGGDDSFINMATGGMLALFGDGSGSLADFLGLIDGTDAIRYWDYSVSGWADITGASYGIDYTLEYLTESDLTGYTMLTVPEPGTVLLFGLGGLFLRRGK